MLERYIEVPREFWDFPSLLEGTEGFQVLGDRVVGELKRVWGETDISWGRVIADTLNKVIAKVNERKVLGTEADQSRTNLRVFLSVSEGNGRIRIGLTDWAQPRPRV